MIAPYPPDTIQLASEWELAGDGTEPYLYNADRFATTFDGQDERRNYRIIDGHAYYQMPPAPAPSIWRGRGVDATRSIADAPDDY